MNTKRLSLLTLVALLALAPQSPSQSAAAPTPPSNVLTLSLARALAIALGRDGNRQAALAEERIVEARAKSSLARAALLPHLESSVGQQSVTRNLEALGIRIPVPGTPFTLPPLAGPFNVFDARLTVSQALFHLGSTRRFQASRTGVSLSEAESEAARDRVRDEVARAYLGTLRFEATLAAARADLELSEALLELARSQKEAGTGTGIEITRARARLAYDRQRLVAAENDLKRSHLQLLRLLGADLGAALALTDNLSFSPLAPPPAEEAVLAALENRADWTAQQLREKGARQGYGAAAADRTPSVALFADYGSIGPGIGNAIPTRTYGIAVRIPLFDGGRLDALRAEGASRLRQESIRTQELRSVIELEVRVALHNLEAAAEQVAAARDGLSLAESELAQARRRLEAGVGIGLEVTDAQSRLERARENWIAALYGHRLAVIELGTATGTIRQVVQ